MPLRYSSRSLMASSRSLLASSCSLSASSRSLPSFSWGLVFSFRHLALAASLRHLTISSRDWIRQG
jgi:hypothetical protein